MKDFGLANSKILKRLRCVAREGLGFSVRRQLNARTHRAPHGIGAYLARHEAQQLTFFACKRDRILRKRCRSSDRSPMHGAPSRNRASHEASSCSSLPRRLLAMQSWRAMQRSVGRIRMAATDCRSRLLRGQPMRAATAVHCGAQWREPLVWHRSASHWPDVDGLKSWI